MSISQDYLLPLLHQSSFIGPGAHSSGQLDQNYQAQMCVHSAALYDKVLGQHYGHVFVKSLLFMFFCKLNCKAYFYSGQKISKPQLFNRANLFLIIFVLQKSIPSPVVYCYCAQYAFLRSRRYYEESLVSSNLNSKLLSFHCAHSNQYTIC